MQLLKNLVYTEHCTEQNNQKSIIGIKVWQAKPFKQKSSHIQSTVNYCCVSQTTNKQQSYKAAM